MQLLTTYQCETGSGIVRHYARVALDDGSTLEIASERALDKAEWLALAEQAVAASVITPTIFVEAEDATLC